MLLIELNLYWTQNISLKLVNTQEYTYVFKFTAYIVTKYN